MKFLNILFEKKENSDFLPSFCWTACPK